MLYLLPVLVCSAALLWRLAGERDGWLLASASVGLSSVIIILMGAFFLPWAGPEKVLGAFLPLSLLVLAALLRSPPGPAAPSGSSRKEVLLAALLGLPGLALVVFSSLFILSVSLVVEDGVFLHASNIGQIMAGHYPPLSFLGEPLQGHQGKDLLTALWAVAFRCDFLQADWISTCLLQACHFVFLLSWFRVETGKASYALLGAYFAFVGSSFGSHLGLVDTVTNNNAVAFFTLSLCGYLLRRWLLLGTWGSALLAGVVLGADAMIYEVHFGLLGLTLFFFTVPRRERYRGFLVVVLTALVMASFEGGAITNLVHKKFHPPPPSSQEGGRSSQSQNVELHFPKPDLFHVRRDNLRPSRFFETRLRPAEADFTPSREMAPLWSPQILTCFWYPVWLSPLVLLGLCKGRNGLGGWFFSLGLFSILTPCVVSFGYFDIETGRWFFGASVALSTAYGLGLAQLCQLPTRWRYLGWVVTAWSLWFNFPALPLRLGELSASLHNPGAALPDGSPGIVPGGGLIPQPRLSLEHHFHFGEADWKLFQRLHDLGRDKGDFPTNRYLVNYPDDPPPTGGGAEGATGGLVDLIGLQTGVSGLLPAGISGAPLNRWCPTLFSQSLAARAFWSAPQLWRLQNLGGKVEWLVTDGPVALPNLQQVYQDGPRAIWQVDAPPHPVGQLVTVKELGSVTSQGQLKARQPYTLTCAPGGEPGLAKLTLRYVTPDGEVANPDDLLPEQFELSPLVTLHLVGPYYPGTYLVEWSNAGQDRWQSLGSFRFE